MATRIPIGTVAALQEQGRLIGVADGRHVGVFQVGSDLVAYENKCPHLGGPICAGKVFRRIDAGLEEGEVIERFSDSELVLHCPWHGWGFDLMTGRCNADPRYRLRALKVSIEGDEVVIEA